MACTDGDVRLVDGDRVGRGRLELCMNGEWGTVCRNRFNRPDATVVCRQLGFSRFREFIFRYYHDVMISIKRRFLFPGTGYLPKWKWHHFAD